MGENKLKNLPEIQHLVESAISERSRDDIVNILERISLLKPPERLLLYMRMPSGAPETDPLRQPQNPLGTRSEINHTINWVRSHLEHDSNVSIPKQDVYDDYFSYCTRINIKPLSTADFGKVMKQVFPNIRPRRLGTRGNSRYCYAALRKTTRLAVPDISMAIAGNCESDAGNSTQQTQMVCTVEEEQTIRGWASKVLHVEFSSAKELADYITTNHLSENSNRNSKPRQVARSRACSKEKNTTEVHEMDPVASGSNKKRRKKQRNSVSSETSRATSPVPDNDSFKVTIKSEPDTQPNVHFSPLSHSQNSMVNPYVTVAPDRGVDKSPLHVKQMKTERHDAEYVDDDEAVSQMMDLSDDDPQAPVLCKKVRQAQQTKGRWTAQRTAAPPGVDTMPMPNDEHLMRPPINNNPQSRQNNNCAAELTSKRHQLPAQRSDAGGEKDDVSTDLIIPRERVISICNLDKDALDDYLNGGDNSQDQEAEILKYFQTEEQQPQNMSVDGKPNVLHHASSSSSMDTFNMLNDATSTDPKLAAKRSGYDKNISELRWHLQQSLQQPPSGGGSNNNNNNPDPTNQAVGAFRSQSQPTTIINRGGTNELIKDEVILDFATAANKMSFTNSRQIFQPKRDGCGHTNVSSPCSSTLNGHNNVVNQPNSVVSGQLGNIEKPSCSVVSTNIPQSPNSRRKNFCFVPISPGPDSPSGSSFNLNQPTVVTSSAPFNHKHSPFVSPRSASHRKPYKQNCLPSSTATTTTTTINNSNIQPINQLSSALYGNIQSAPFSFGRNNVAISAPPSPSPLLQMRHDRQLLNHQFSSFTPSDSAKKLPFDSDSSDVFGNRSQSVPLHCQMPNMKAFMFNSNSLSLAESPVSNQYSEFMDMVDGTSGSNDGLVKMEQLATDLSVAGPSVRSSTMNFNPNLGMLSLPEGDSLPMGNLLSRSVPSTPQPSRLYCNAGPSSMAMFDISKSVPTTPVANSFCGTRTPFRYSPSEMNRDFLINGNTIEPLGGGTSFFGSAGQDQSDTQNSNLSERDLRIVTEDIDELSSFGDAADPIIGSDLLNNL